MKIKELLPYVLRELDKGRTKTQIYKELGLNYNQIKSMNFYLKRNAEKPLIDYAARNRTPIVVIRGKIYRDVTRLIVDCGG